MDRKLTKPIETNTPLLLRTVSSSLHPSSACLTARQSVLSLSDCLSECLFGYCLRVLSACSAIICMSVCLFCHCLPVCPLVLPLSSCPPVLPLFSCMSACLAIVCLFCHHVNACFAIVFLSVCLPVPVNITSPQTTPPPPQPPFILSCLVHQPTCLS